MRLAAAFSALFIINLYAQAPKEEVLVVSLPDKPWTLQIPAPGFAVTQNITQTDGRRYLLASNKDSVISVTLERVSGAATLDGCRDVFQGRIKPGGPFKLAEIKQSQIGDMAVMEYMIPAANGLPVNQKNIFGCLAKEDVYADIHVSKADFKATDGDRLNTLLRSAKFVNAAEANVVNSLPASSAAFFAEGSRHFLLKEYDKAIGPYQEALSREKQQSSLDTTKWRVLVDNLAMAYGITGNLTAADEVIAYGIAKDPSYPLFYFMAADSYAERNDFNNMMKSLQLALKFRGNVIPGESLPDPLADDSFQRYWNNDEFKKLAAQFR